MMQSRALRYFLNKLCDDVSEWAHLGHGDALRRVDIIRCHLPRGRTVVEFAAQPRISNGDVSPEVLPVGTMTYIIYGIYGCISVKKKTQTRSVFIACLLPSIYVWEIAGSYFKPGEI